jgi:hypothetical protein
LATERFVRFFRTLSVAPSRREVNLALAGLAASSVFTRLMGSARIEAKKNSKHLKKWKRYCKAYNYVWCPVEYAPKYCCQHVCTECGCCYEGGSQCCLPGATFVQDGFGIESPYYPCCGDDQTCCLGTNNEVRCCDPDQICCGGACCAPAFSSQCCGGVNCCHHLETCCPDGVCRLAC